MAKELLNIPTQLHEINDICAIYCIFAKLKVMKMDLKKEVKEEFIRFQRNEKTESIVYERLASIEKDESNQSITSDLSRRKSALCHTEETKTGQVPLQSRAYESL